MREISRFKVYKIEKYDSYYLYKLYNRYYCVPLSKNKDMLISGCLDKVNFVSKTIRFNLFLVFVEGKTDTENYLLRSVSGFSIKNKIDLLEKGIENLI